MVMRLVPLLLDVLCHATELRVNMAKGVVI